MALIHEFEFDSVKMSYCMGILKITVGGASCSIPIPSSKLKTNGPWCSPAFTFKTMTTFIEASYYQEFPHKHNNDDVVSIRIKQLLKKERCFVVSYDDQAKSGLDIRRIN